MAVAELPEIETRTSEPGVLQPQIALGLSRWRTMCELKQGAMNGSWICWISAGRII